jgi:hypothetical protein
MLFERLENLVRVQVHVPHDLTEHIPLNLSKGQAYVLVRQQDVFTSTGFVECPVDDALG